MIKWIIYFIIDFLLFYYFSFRVGGIGLVVIFLKFLWDSGLFKGIKFYKAVLKNSEIYYIDYVGEYSEIYKEFNKINLIMKKFKLNEHFYSTFGIYYDDPKKVDPKKCRAVIGIIKEIDPDMRTSIIAKDEELTDYLIKNSYKKGVIPETECILSTFPFIHPFSMMIGIKKFYSTLDSSLNSEEFRKAYSIDRKKFKLSIEVYNKMYNEIQFYIPMKNLDKLNLHSIKDHK